MEERERKRERERERERERGRREREGGRDRHYDNIRRKWKVKVIGVR